ncbi:hypothetical protein Q0590_35475 [Rhodocytophaga aerolata]|uniref:Carboxypeptidase regulatory-like domain-containing protein n=1 Tax=Rhodocytophaga aerolata TaxID=455078 RepID=A0ABT8RJZ8_9BACT|nr:hypothetical protein [Rhodocytophaga aerolata]MDO1451628.1 hypothetical protein [Rhodocytophaga aerolata]
MKPLYLLINLLLSVLLITACTTDPDTNPAPSPTSPQKGYASGKVTDTQGKPLANADIVVNNAQLYNYNVLGQSDAKGEYSLKLTPGSWYVRGTVTVSFDNKTYVLDLHPDKEGGFAGSEGAVCNLQWKLTGPKPTEFGGNGYYGGLVEVYGEGNFVDTQGLELTLEPIGRLIDGSEGQKIVRQLEGQSIGQTQDIPIGRYRITARYLPTGQILNLRLRNADQDYASDVTSSFEPAYLGATGSYKLTLEARLP